MTPAKPTHTPPRQIRIGPTWEQFDLAAKATGATRAQVINAFIDWYLHEPGTPRTFKRPDRALWDPTAPEHSPPAG
jgi:hypothetical protein